MEELTDEGSEIVWECSY
ncbi:hypothetical protein [Gilliamella apicola]